MNYFISKQDLNGSQENNVQSQKKRRS